jgi:SSS family solute:Na+ symporter
MCLVLVGLFFAYKLYQKSLITLGDYYRQRYRAGPLRCLCSAIIMFSYLGWVAAQITALGLVFNLLTQGRHVSVTMGMVHWHAGGADLHLVRWHVVCGA